MITKHMYMENRFLNVTYAAEAFHRITHGGTKADDEEFQAALSACVNSAPAELQSWLRDELNHNNALTLRKRLQDLATRANPAVRPIIRDKARWSHLAAQVRNEIAHVGDKSRDLDGSDLYFLSESVYDVVRICMLQEAGVSMDVLAAKASIYAVSWYKDRLHQTLDRLRAWDQAPQIEPGKAEV
jgi:hypothetical protein